MDNLSKPAGRPRALSDGIRELNRIDEERVRQSHAWDEAFVRLVVRDGYTVADVARALGVSTSAGYKMWRRIRERRDVNSGQAA